MAPGPFVVVGESLVDVVQPADGEPVLAPGGSPLNVAVGLARLEVDTVLVTQLGDDEHGRLVARHATASTVRLAETAVTAGRRTSTATARLDEDHAASYEFDLTWDLDRHRLPEGTAGLHVGSLGAVLRPGREAVLDLLAQAEGGFVSYDPNVRPAFVTDPARTWRDVAEVAAHARLVKCSEADLAALRPGEDEPALAGELLTAGATELVVVTKGAHGASAYRDGLRVDVPAPATTVVDTVGAGDSFMAALLAVLSDWDLLSLDEGSLAALGEHRLGLLLEGATQAAAVTCARRGANPPTRRELPSTWPAG
ncbi:MAG: carbohydrate kinase family protein [Nocardioidaceae bacterium]